MTGARRVVVEVERQDSPSASTKGSLQAHSAAQNKWFNQVRTIDRIELDALAIAEKKKEQKKKKETK